MTGLTSSVDAHTGMHVNKLQCALCASHAKRNEHNTYTYYIYICTDASKKMRTLLCEVLDTNVAAIKVVDWDTGTKESLNLAAVEINRNNTVHSHGLQQASNVCCRDRDAGGHLAVLTGIAVVRDDHSDSFG